MKVIKFCQSDLTHDYSKRKVLTKIILQQLEHVPVTTGLMPPADIFTLHFTGSARADLTASQSLSASTRSLNEI